MDYAIAALLTTFTSLAELISRYRDAPAKFVFRLPAAWFYLAINALAGVLVLYWLRSSGITFNQSGEQLRWIQIFSGGFIAAILMRSSLFVLHTEGKEAPIGPSAILSALLQLSDRQMDLLRGRRRAETVQMMIQNFSYEETATLVQSLTSAFIQVLPPEEREKIDNLASQLAGRGDISDQVKSLMLGLALIDYVGEEALLAAVNSLRSQVSTEGIPQVQAGDVGASRESLLSEIGSAVLAREMVSKPTPYSS